MQNRDSVITQNHLEMSFFDLCRPLCTPVRMFLVERDIGTRRDAHRPIVESIRPGAKYFSPSLRLQWDRRANQLYREIDLSGR